MDDIHSAPPSGAQSAVDRRKLMRGFGLGVTGAAAMGALAAGGLVASSKPAAAASITDADIFNFALNLEYLEAEFYLRATTGHGLRPAEVSGTGTLGDVTGGRAVPFASDAVREYANRITHDEVLHVRFIRKVLGDAAVARPAIDLSDSFTNLAVAAGLITAGQSFDPFADDVSFLLGAYIFEDVGVTAYAGAARLLTNPDNLEAAAGILGTEAYHAGAIRASLSSYGPEVGAATDLISRLRAKLSGGPKDDRGLIVRNPAYATHNIVDNDANGLAYRRTAAQVLNIVYGGGAASNFLFFPNKLNGAIA